VELWENRLHDAQAGAVGGSRCAGLAGRCWPTGRGASLEGPAPHGDANISIVNWLADVFDSGVPVGGVLSWLGQWRAAVQIARSSGAGRRADRSRVAATFLGAKPTHLYCVGPSSTPEVVGNPRSTSTSQPVAASGGVLVDVLADRSRCAARSRDDERGFGLSASSYGGQLLAAATPAPGNVLVLSLRDSIDRGRNALLPVR